MCVYIYIYANGRPLRNTAKNEPRDPCAQETAAVGGGARWVHLHTYIH